MRRLLALTLIASLGSGSAAFAAESIFQSASRLARDASQTSSSIAVDSANAGHADAVIVSHAANWMNKVNAETAALEGQATPVLSKSGLRRRTKAMIFIAMGVGFAASAYAIDHKVLDVTPSSLGTRKD